MKSSRSGFNIFNLVPTCRHVPASEVGQALRPSVRSRDGECQENGLLLSADAERQIGKLVSEQLTPAAKRKLLKILCNDPQLRSQDDEAVKCLARMFHQEDLLPRSHCAVSP